MVGRVETWRNGKRGLMQTKERLSAKPHKRRMRHAWFQYEGPTELTASLSFLSSWRTCSGMGCLTLASKVDIGAGDEADFTLRGDGGPGKRGFAPGDSDGNAGSVSDTALFPSCKEAGVESRPLPMPMAAEMAASLDGRGCSSRGVSAFAGPLGSFCGSGAYRLLSTASCGVIASLLLIPVPISLGTKNMLCA